MTQDIDTQHRLYTHAVTRLLHYMELSYSCPENLMLKKIVEACHLNFVKRHNIFVHGE
jgi:hypothetical protein